MCIAKIIAIPVDDPYAAMNIFLPM